MSRRALLIGVSEYGEGFDSLPGSLRDVRKMANVLGDSEQGAFEKPIVLENPTLNEIKEEIEQFFRGAGSEKDDLLLLYFSGHGDLGSDFVRQQLHLCAKGTRKLNGQLMESSAMSAEFLKRQMDLSKSTQIIVILDCCYSGAIADLLRKGDEDSAFNELRAPGRVILASSSASQSSYQSTDGLSLYTHYLLEGMTGAAQPKNSHAPWIVVQDLHAYAERRFEVEQRGGVSPKIIVARDTGYDIPIVKAPRPLPLLDYRQEVDELFQDLDRERGLEFKGKIEEPLARARLETSRLCLGTISPEEAQKIEQEVQAPYLAREKQRRDYERNFELAVKDGFLPDDFNLKQLEKIRQNIGLGKEDADRIAQFISRQRRLRPRPATLSSSSQSMRFSQLDVGWAEAAARATATTTQLGNEAKAAASKLSSATHQLQSHFFTRRTFLNSLRLAGIGFCLAYIIKNLDLLKEQLPKSNLSLNGLDSRNTIPPLMRSEFEAIEVNESGIVIGTRSSFKYFFEEDLGQGILIEMIQIKTENFPVDTSISYIEDSQGRRVEEVKIPNFFISRTEITQEQYEVITGQTPSLFIGKTRPVERVSWYDAQAFCQLLSKRTGKKYRLPTEDEWEYACRATTITPFHFGKVLIPSLANYRESTTGIEALLSLNQTKESKNQTKDVGSFQPNGFGLCDMHGNVSEWCGDYLYIQNQKVTLVRHPAYSTTSENLYGVRGGSYSSLMEESSSTSRQSFPPNYSSEVLGFRIACSF